MQNENLQGFRLSPQQERLWRIQQNKQIYWNQCTIRLIGEVQVTVLEKSLKEIVRRHEIFRTAFRCLTGMDIPVQVIEEHNEVSWCYVDLTETSSQQAADLIANRSEMECKSLLSLEQGPMMRVVLFACGINEHLLLISLPSICADNQTLTTIMNEISLLYDLSLQGQSLADEAVQYADTSEWQHELLEEQSEKKQYWETCDLSRCEILPSPFRCEDTSGLSTLFEPSSMRVNIDDLSAHIAFFSQQRDCSTTALLLLCWAILLGRISHNKDFVIAVLFDGRSYDELEGAAGLYAKYLPLNIKLDFSLSFLDALSQLRLPIEQAAISQEYFDVEQMLRTQKDTLRQSPFYWPVCFSLETGKRRAQGGGISFSVYTQKSLIDRYEIELSCVETDGTVSAAIHYDPTRFPREGMQILAHSLEALVKHAIMFPETTLSDLNIVDETQQKFISDLNATAIAYPEQMCIHQLFEEQAKRTPNAVAVIYEEKGITYAELNAQANQLAHFLSKRGILPDTPVGLLIERSTAMIIALLAILKAGGAYVPLDPGNPKDRLARQITEMQFPLLLTQQTLLAQLPACSCEIVCLDRDQDIIVQESTQNPVCKTTLNHLAYIMYTSGSTGIPKGVAIEHRSLVNYAHSICQKLQITQRLNFAIVSTLSADLGNTIIFPSLITGGCMHILPYNIIIDGNAFSHYFSVHHIDVLKIVPSHFKALFYSSQSKEILPKKYLIFGGEALSLELIHQIRTYSHTCTILNHYGPTETTVGSLLYFVPNTEAIQGICATIPIGRPIANTSVYILDAYRHPVPPGTEGELYIGGAGVARGYVNQPEQTNEHFIQMNVFTDHPILLYKTGDIVRYLPDGNIEFLRRVDSQVKIRGFRVELKEIAVLLERHPAVQECVIVAKEDSREEKHIIAYVVIRSSYATSVIDLQTYMQQHLPEYMRPAHFLILERLPLTSNGKVDYAALPSPETSTSTALKVSSTERSPLKELLITIWAELLGLAHLSIHDNFFSLGGHSLLATQLVARIRSTLNVEIPLSYLFDAPTIQEQSDYIDAMLSENHIQDMPIVAFPHSDFIPLSFAQQRLWFFDYLEPGNVFYTIPVVIRLDGALNIAVLDQSLREIIRRHEVLRVTFHMMEDGQPVQTIENTIATGLFLMDIHSLLPEKRSLEVENLIREEAAHPFDLEHGPLLRFTLLRMGSEEHIFVLTMHHIISDAWSQGIFFRELVALYTAFSRGEASPLAPLPIQYADYALWQRQWFQGTVLERQVAYWKTQLAAAPDFLPLPTDHPRPALQRYQGASSTRLFPRTLCAELLVLSRKEQVTLFMTVLSAFQILLMRYSGQTDILVGTPIANRHHLEIEPLIGFFVNTLVLRTSLAGNPTVRELLARVRQVALGAYAHQDLPFEQLVDALQPQRNLSHAPLFQVLFLFQNVPFERVELPELRLQVMEVESTTAKFDLTLAVTELPEGLRVAVEYNTDLFEATTIQRLLGHLQTVLQAMVRDPQQTIGTLSLLTEAEREQMMVTWNATRNDGVSQDCLHELFERQVERTPEAIALVCGQEQITYALLNQRANQLARSLQNVGVGPEMVVGLCLLRSLEMLVGLLAILKAGGAYLPLDPSYPQERLAFMLADAQATVLLTQQALLDRWASSDVISICLDRDRSLFTQFSTHNLACHLRQEHLAYVIYTSGSTGRPKGVMVSHFNVVNFFLGMDAELDYAPSSSWLAVTSISFDISALELFWTLAHGFRIVIQEEKYKDSEKSSLPSAQAQKSTAFSLFYFANNEEKTRSENKYRLLIEGAKFADEHAFEAIWTPERHFHPFGGLYPNPSVISAAIASVTKHLKIRAGSVVLPLHHPVRIAEEWSVVDNLSGGRVGLSFASGWHSNDFVLAPGNYAQRREKMYAHIELVRKLWRGDNVIFPGGKGEDVPVSIFPLPIQKDLPIWITAAGNPETFRQAGAMGTNVLTHLLGQNLDELEEKIRLYRKAWREHGHGPGEGQVTLMLHTFVGKDEATVRQLVREPFIKYLLSSVDLGKALAKSLQQDDEIADVTDEEMELLLSQSFERYYQRSGLLGTVESCLERVQHLREIGVDELACLIDFGVDEDVVLENLHHLHRVMQLANSPSNEIAEEESLAQTLIRQGISHLQCTPSLASTLLLEAVVKEGIHNLSHLLLGGELLPQSLADQVRSLMTGSLHNMYGPTETTIWSSTQRIDCTSEQVTLGHPIVNTQLYILDTSLQPVPIGVPGEICIGGHGVVRGYWERADLTAERFTPHPWHEEPGQRLYRTGDRAKYREDGTIEYLGRMDTQIKLRGFRIELGEVEAVLEQHPAIKQAVALVREDVPGDRRLVAYVLPTDESSFEPQQIRQFVHEKLPEYMVPAYLVSLPGFPLTANGKVNRAALPTPRIERPVQTEVVTPRTAIEATLVTIWKQVLRLEQVGIHDNFFALGGDSILSIQVIARARQAGLVLRVKQLFQQQTISELAAVAVAAPVVVAEQEQLSGPAPLLPMQHWFFAQQLPGRHYYNQAIVLRFIQPLHIASFEQAVAHLLQYHDGLRMRFVHDVHGWQAHFADVEVSAPVHWIDVQALMPVQQREAVGQWGQWLQPSLDLSQGPLLRIAVIDGGPEQGGWVVLVAHHLVIDGVSWRILLTDLHQVYLQIRQGEMASLPAKTLSVRAWAQRLQEYVQAPEQKEEHLYWQHVISQCQTVQPLPMENAQGRNTEADAETISVYLQAEETHQLLQMVPSVYQTQIQEILLTALWSAVTAWTGAQQLLVDLEGHGREALFPDVDLSRTVGWLTSLFPVCLASESREVATVIKNIKEQMRALPQQGIGYGLWRYLSGDKQEHVCLDGQAQILFNYLGRFDQLFAPGAVLKLVREASGFPHDERGERSYLLTINGMVVEGELWMHWTYSRQIHKRETIEWLAQRFIQSLREIIAHCLSPLAGGFTPSDFPLAHLDQKTLDDWKASQTDLEDVYPLAPIQQGFFFHNLLAIHSGAYLVQQVFSLKGNIDLDLLVQVWQQAINRYPILRSSLVWDGLIEPLQIVHQHAPLCFDYQDLRDLVPLEQQDCFSAYIQSDRAKGFELDEVPLMRLALWRYGEQDYTLVWSYHHLLLDGWSFSLLCQEIFTQYRLLSRGEEVHLTSITPYRDYIVWLQRQDVQRAETFWREKLKGVSPSTLMNRVMGSSGYSQPKDYSLEERLLDSEITAELFSYVRQQHITLSVLFQAAWALLLSKYNRSNDIVFGMVVSGRTPELENAASIIGPFINTLPIRVCVPNSMCVSDWLQDLQEQLVTLRQYEHCPLLQIQQWSGLPSGNSLFETLLVFENLPVDPSFQMKDEALAIDKVYGIERAHYPFTLQVEPGPRLRLRIIYDGQCFSVGDIQQILEHVCILLKGLLEKSTQSVEHIPLLTQVEQDQVLAPLKTIRKDEIAEGCLHELFERQVERTPEAIALVCGQEQITYALLNRRANQLARSLQSLGVGPEVVVALCLPRSLDMLIGLLAILKAGGAYLPLDPTTPAERLALLLRDAHPQVLLIQHERSFAFLPQVPHIFSLQREGPALWHAAHTTIESPVCSQNLAYLLYTSGSTGTPKGVLLSHQGVVNLAKGQAQMLALDASSRILQFASLTFDASVSEIAMTWQVGACLHLVPADQLLVGSHLLHILAEQAISIVTLPPSILATLPPAPLPLLTTLIVAGEACPAALLPLWGTGRSLVNAYGPTETTVCATMGRWHGSSRWLPLGHPLPQTHLLLLDERLHLVPVGVVGEICLGGPNLARGYHQQAERTAESFIPHPFSPQAGARLYRTGDLARSHRDGSLEFVGRRDRQVKVRGVRIELGEIEALLQEHPAIQGAIVRVWEKAEGDQRLVAYVVLRPGEPWGWAEVRQYLRERLPDVMVPALGVMLAQFPLTANGKIDQARLPHPEEEEEEGEAQRGEPTTELEAVLASLWAQVLGRKRVGIHESFFDLGGHSLLATQLISRITAEFGMEMPLRSLFEAPRVVDFAEAWTKQQFEHLSQEEQEILLQALYQEAD